MFPFVESASWADKIPFQGWATMADWHFNNQTSKEEGFNPVPKPYDPIQENIKWAIGQAYDALVCNVTPKNSISIDSTMMKSIAVRNLIHLIGDIHQPLHMANYFSNEFPRGTENGYLFKIDRYVQKSANNLHFVWDNIFDLNIEDQAMQSPLTELQYARVVQFGEDIYARFREDPNFQEQIENNSNVEDWAKESFDIADQIVYAGIKQHVDLPEWYVNQGKLLVMKRMALAGRRLADTILEIYKTQKDGTVEDNCTHIKED